MNLGFPYQKEQRHSLCFIKNLLNIEKKKHSYRLSYLYKSVTRTLEMPVTWKPPLQRLHWNPVREVCQTARTPGTSGKNTQQSPTLFVCMTSHAVKKRLYSLAEKENWYFVSVVCLVQRLFIQRCRTLKQKLVLPNVVKIELTLGSLIFNLYL